MNKILSLDEIEKRAGTVINHKKSILLSLIATGIILRIVFTDWNHFPITPDTLVYLSEALSYSHGDAAIQNRMLWPFINSIAFLPVSFEDNLGYVNLIRINSIIISSLTIPIVYLVTLKLVNSRGWSLVAAAIFMMESNIIANSSYGIREPLFLMIGLSSIFFLVQKNDKLFWLTFVFAGLSFLTDWRGSIIFLIVFVAYSIKIQRKTNMILILIIGTLIFLAVSFPELILSFEDEEAPFIRHVLSVINLLNSENETTATFDGTGDSSKIETALFREILHTGRILLPILAIFGIVGFFALFKNFGISNKIIFISISITWIVNLLAYTVSADFRNLILLVPLFAITSTIGMKMIFQNKNHKKIIITITLISFMILSMGFLIYQIEDAEELDEKSKFAQFVINNFEGRFMGDQYGILSFHVVPPVIGIEDEADNVSNEKIGLVVSEFPLDSEEKLIQYITNRNIDFLIVDDIKDNRYLVFEEIFQNESNFTYLEKVFDSTENGFVKLNVKIYKIDRGLIELYN